MIMAIWFGLVSIKGLMESVAITFGDPMCAEIILCLIILTDQRYCRGVGFAQLGDSV